MESITITLPQAILNFMVAKSGVSDAVTRDTVEVLQHAGLFGTRYVNERHCSHVFQTVWG